MKALEPTETRAVAFVGIFRHPTDATATTPAGGDTAAVEDLVSRDSQGVLAG